MYNGGTVEIFGGTICQNRASGFQGSGGLGGAVYNAAGALFRNSGGTIRDNDSRSGGDIYSEGVRQEVVSPAPDAAKKEPGGADAYQKAERGKKKQSGKKKQTPKGAEKNKNKENKKKKENTGRADDTGRAEGSSPAGDQSPDGNRGKKEARLPEIHVSPRFFFDWEVQNYREEQWKRELSAYRGEARTRWSWRGLLSDKQGTYSVKMRIGKRSVTIPVTIVSEWEEPETHLQFCEPEGLPAEEVWYFSSDDLKSVRQWMKGREDLFSQAANREFGRIFGRRN